MSSFEFSGKCWKQGIPVIDNDGNESVEWQVVPITSVPIEYLLVEYEDLVVELSDKQMELYQLKEACLIAERQIVETTDFKSIYGANNQKVRDNHVKAELSDMVEQRASLQFGIDFIQSYIPLLRECIRVKHDSIPHINSPKPIVLDGSNLNNDKLRKQIKKALEYTKQ